WVGGTLTLNDRGNVFLRPSSDFNRPLSWFGPLVHLSGSPRKKRTKRRKGHASIQVTDDLVWIQKVRPKGLVDLFEQLEQLLCFLVPLWIKPQKVLPEHLAPAGG